MPARPLLVDVTRLLTRLRHPAPTGIDRVDLAYARRYLSPPYSGQAIAVTPFGPRLLPRGRDRHLLSAVAARWPSQDDGKADPVLDHADAWLGAGRAVLPTRKPSRTASMARPTLLRWRLIADAAAWTPAAAAPDGAIYLHTSHLRLDRPRAFDWLYGRQDVRPVFFVHDLIPIEFPEYGVPGEAVRHRRRLETVARHAAAVVTNSEDVASRLRGFLRRNGSRVPSMAAALLGVEAEFRPGGAPLAASRPYFVAVSTIEARKNHLLLLQIWRDLAARRGPDTPALVLVGRRGWESEAAADLLDRCDVIRPHVLELSGMSSAGLARLVGGARALLMPSFAEGYGIPVAEALSLGTPVIASDIAAHREIAGGAATLLDPLDGTGWREAIVARAAAPAGTGPIGYRRPSWADHFAIVDRLLDGL